MAKLVLLLGSNMGDRHGNLKQAIQALNISISPVILQSSLYETAAWGNTDQASFFNICIVIETLMKAEQLLEYALEIEKKLGRTRTVMQYSPRIIDIDILFYGDTIVNLPDLVIPHPHIAARRFTLTPLAEILPGFVHPVYKKTLLELCNDCSDTLACTSIGTL